MGLLEENSTIKQQIAYLEKSVRILELQRAKGYDSPHITIQIEELNNRIVTLLDLLTLLEDEIFERSVTSSLQKDDWRGLNPNQKFIDRMQELSTLNHFLASQSGIDVINITGQGGSGKSFLLKHFGNECTSKGVPWAILDEGIVSGGKLYIMQSIRSQFRSNIDEVIFKEFDQAVSRFNNYLEELANTQEKASCVLPELKLQLLQKIDKILVEVFRSACGKIETKVVLIIDTYEKVSPDMDKWICHTLLSCLPKLTLCVIAGREELKSDWANYWNFARIQLLSFSLDTINDFLHSRGIKNHNITKQIYELTRGLPLFLTMVPIGSTLTAVRDFDLHIYIQSLLQNLPKHIEEALPIFAIFRRFDEQTIKYFQLPISYNEISNLGFVNKNSNGLIIHDEIRKYLLDNLRDRNPSEFMKLNRHAAEYYLSIREGVGETGRKMAIVEELYHRLIIDPVSAMSLIKTHFDSAEEKYDFNFCEALIEIFHSVDIHDPEMQLWAQYYIGRYYLITRDWANSKTIFDQIIINMATPKLEGLTHNCLGNCLFEIYDLDNAISHYSKAIDIFNQLDDTENLATTYRELGEAYRQKRVLEKSVEANEESVRLWRKLGNRHEEGRSLSLLATAQRTKGSEDKSMLSKSILTYQSAIKIQSQTEDKIGLALTLRELGSAYFRIGLLNEAEKHYERSRRIEKSINNDYGLAFALNGIGQVYAQTKRIPEAIAVFKKALDIQQRMGHRFGTANTLHSLGRLYIECQDYQSAIELLKTSRESWIELGNHYKANYVLTSLAKAELLKGNIKKAKKYFMESMLFMQKQHMEADIAENLFGLAQVYLESKELGEAEKCLKSALDIFEGRQSKRQRECLIMLSKIKLFQGNIEEAKALLNSIKSNLDYHDNDDVVTDICIIRLEIAITEGDSKSALENILHTIEAVDKEAELRAKIINRTNRFLNNCNNKEFIENLCQMLKTEAKKRKIKMDDFKFCD